MWKSSIKVRIRKRVYTEKYKNIRIQICYRLHSFSNHQCCGSEPGADHWFVKKKYYQKVHKIIKALRLENLFLKNFYNGLCKSIYFVFHWRLFCSGRIQIPVSKMLPPKKNSDSEFGSATKELIVHCFSFLSVIHQIISSFQV